MGIPWEDFVSDCGHHVTIVADNEHRGEAQIECDLTDGWYDATVEKLDMKSAKQVLAVINGVSPEDIEVVEEGIVLSI